MSYLNIFQKVSGQKDIVLSLLFVVIIVMMVLPLPTGLIDALVGFNITFAVLILITTIYTHNAVDLSVFPSLLLISTLFRLAISISTTRLILLQADAGKIIDTFGQFVIQGNLAVGLVIFFIITIVQFIVITKGSERVAEVSARFSLDGMPGKQMSIDADVRAGLIDNRMAKERRVLLEKENQLYGAMDGAMKFVKGDAIAGLVITVVNITGGLVVGMIQQGMDLGEALKLYSVLTIGDGLVAQIPALFLSIAAGIIVTRVSVDSSTDLAIDITAQLLDKPKSLMVVAGILYGACLIPGFPVPVFFFLGSAVLAAGLHELRKQHGSLRGLFSPDVLDDDMPLALPGAAAKKALSRYDPSIVVSLPAARLSDEDQQQLQRSFHRLHYRLVSGLGIALPDVVLTCTPDHPSSSATVSRDDVMYDSFPIPDQGQWMFPAGMRDELSEMEVEFTKLQKTKLDDHVVIDEDEFSMLPEGLKSKIKPLPEYIVENIESIIPYHIADFITMQDIYNLIRQVEGEYPQLCREVLQSVPIAKLTEILRSLLGEAVPITQIAKILDVLAYHGPEVEDPVILGELVRVALGRQIVQQHATQDLQIKALVFDNDAQQALHDYVVESGAGKIMLFPTDMKDALTEQILHHKAACPGLVVITSMDLRRHLNAYFRQEKTGVPVLSFEEIGGVATIDTLAHLQLPNNNVLQIPDQMTA